MVVRSLPFKSNILRERLLITVMLATFFPTRIPVVLKLTGSPFFDHRINGVDSVSKKLMIIGPGARLVNWNCTLPFGFPRHISEASVANGDVEVNVLIFH